jgi:hypothetical protein
MGTRVCDAQDHGSEAEYLACPVCHPSTELPEKVFGALVDAYVQSRQDVIHSEWGESWPSFKRQEAEALMALTIEVKGWYARYAAAAERDRADILARLGHRS